jgi:hypothetical protein
MDCNNAIGVVRVGGEVVVEAKETGKGNLFTFLRLFVEWLVGIAEDFSLSGPTLKT